MRCQQLVHNIANDRAFNPLSESWDRNGENYPSFVLSSSLTASFRLSISVLGTVSWDWSILRSHNTGADNDEIWNLSEMYLILYHFISPQWIIIFVWTVRLVTDNSRCRGPGYPGTNPIFSPHISSSLLSTVLGSIKRSSSPDTR